MRNTFFVHFWLLYSPFFGQRLKRLRACCFAPQEIYSEHSESSIETALIKIELVWIFTLAILGKKHAELAQDLFPDFSSVWANEKLPSASDLKLRLIPSSVFEMVTVASATRAPDGSSTNPVNVAEEAAVCPYAPGINARSAAQETAKTTISDTRCDLFSNSTPIRSVNARESTDCDLVRRAIRTPNVRKLCLNRSSV